MSMLHRGQTVYTTSELRSGDQVLYYGSLDGTIIIEASFNTLSDIWIVSDKFTSFHERIGLYEGRYCSMLGKSLWILVLRRSINIGL